MNNDTLVWFSVAMGCLVVFSLLCDAYSNWRNKRSNKERASYVKNLKDEIEKGKYK